MASSIGFLIRDGIESDIAACLRLDHGYETDYVWQVSLVDNNEQRQITFQKQHLPRTLETEHVPDERRLRLALPEEHCLLVAAMREGGELMGYLSLRHELVYHTAWIQDVVVSRPYRRHHIGTRLVNAARQWVREQGITRVMLETQTRNYPAIQFAQQIGFTFCGFNDHYFPNEDIAVFFSQTLR
jgi:GNAT superfamily N-acetyltransferase